MFDSPSADHKIHSSYVTEMLFYVFICMKAKWVHKINNICLLFHFLGPDYFTLRWIHFCLRFTVFKNMARAQDHTNNECKEIGKGFKFYNSIVRSGRLQILPKKANNVFALYFFFLSHIITKLTKLAKRWRV